VIWCNVYY